MKKLVLLLCLLLSAPLFAQDRPISGTTVQTTDTTANSLLVGCAIGSTTCTGGIKSGPIVVNAITVINSTGQLAAAQLTGTCCGTATNVPLLNATSNAFSAAAAGIVSLTMANTTSGVAAQERMQQSAGTTNFFIDTYSQGFTTAGSDIAASTRLLSQQPGGLSLVVSDAVAPIRFFTTNTLRWGINSAGDHTFGASSHVADSSGTPTITTDPSSGTASTISGTDYAFTVTIGSVAGTSSLTVTFGHGTFSTPPVCSYPGQSSASAFNFIMVPTTTTIQISPALNWSNLKIYVQCRGF